MHAAKEVGARLLCIGCANRPGVPSNRSRWCSHNDGVVLGIDARGGEVFAHVALAVQQRVPNRVVVRVGEGGELRNIALNVAWVRRKSRREGVREAEQSLKGLAHRDRVI